MEPPNPGVALTKVAPSRNVKALTPPDPERHMAPRQVSFDAFYLAEYPGMLRVAFLVIGADDSAEEIVQEAFVKVHQRWTRLDRPGGYLHTCVVNGCRDHQRRAVRLTRRMPMLVQDHLTAADAMHVPGDGDAQRTDLVDALASLSMRHRTALVLRFYGGFTEAEIAEALDVRPGTVKSLIHRGLERLRQELQP